MKNPRIIRDEVLPQIQNLRYAELRQIVSGITLDKDYPLVENLSEYLQKWQKLLERVKEIEA